MHRPEKTSAPDPKLSPALQKALFITAALVLCALVYVYVRMSSTPSAIASYTPHPSTPTASSASTTGKPTATPGPREAVLVERIIDSGLFLTALEDSPGAYTIGTQQDAQNELLTLSLRDGYVQGFVLKITGGLTPPATGKRTELEALYAREFQKALSDMEARMYAILPILLRELSPDAYFSPATSTAWAQYAAQTLQDGKLVHEEQHGFLFTAARGADYGLTIAVGTE